MRHRRISHDIDAVDWAVMHITTEGYTITYRTNYFDISGMSFMRRVQYRMLAVYEVSPATVEQQAKDAVKYLQKEIRKMRKKAGE